MKEKKETATNTTCHARATLNMSHDTLCLIYFDVKSYTELIVVYYQTITCRLKNRTHKPQLQDQNKKHKKNKNERKQRNSYKYSRSCDMCDALDERVT